MAFDFGPFEVSPRVASVALMNHRARGCHVSNFVLIHDRSALRAALCRVFECLCSAGSVAPSVYVTALALALIAPVGCKRSSPAQQGPPPPAVTVAKPVMRWVMEWDEYSGRLEAVELVQVRSRVGGLIVSTPFEEGTLVRAGDLLVEIDARPYQATLDARLGAAAEARALVQLAMIELQRFESIPEAARASTEMDTAKANVQRAEAQLAIAEAEVVAARLSLEWCRVTAPISGRTSRRSVTVGNLVSGGSDQGTLLTTITSVDPMYCTIDADERSVLRYARLAREGTRVSARQQRIPCVLKLSDETTFSHSGIVDFVDNRLDPSTGTVLGRGVFANPDGWMLPGLFARVRIPGSGRYEALLVPDAAVTSDQNQKILMLVDERNVVQARPVQLGALFGELRAIESGVSLNDRVIVNGLMMARPGLTVNAAETTFSLDSLPADPPTVRDFRGATSMPATAAADGSG